MDADATLVQDQTEISRAAELSRQLEIPPARGGIHARPLAGARGIRIGLAGLRGQHGQADRHQVYTHQRGLDWSLLNREVEKLAVLYTSRNIVRLIDVGWNSEPPYYVMEYLAHGSLASFLSSGPLPPTKPSASPRAYCTLSSTHTAAGFCTATSSRPMSCWTTTSSRACVTSDSRGCRTSKTRRRDRLLHGPRASRPARGARRKMGRLRAGGTALPHVVWQSTLSHGRNRRGDSVCSQPGNQIGRLSPADSDEPQAAGPAVKIGN